MLRLLLLAMGAWSCMVGRAMPTGGSTAGARKISPLVPAQVEQVVVGTEVEMTGMVEVAPRRVADSPVKHIVDIDHETTTGAAEIKAIVEDMDQETTTEAVEQLSKATSYQFFLDGSECKREKRELMKKECEISGYNEHCQTFEIEVDAIVEEEICHNINVLVCKAPSIRSGEEAETTATTVSTAPDAESMDTTTVQKGQKGQKGSEQSEEESENPMMFYGRRLDTPYSDGCVNEVEKVCFSSQRVEKQTRPKEFCWEKEIVSCHDEVGQTVDICDDEKSPPLPQVRVTTIDPDTTTIEHEQLGRILVATTTTVEDLTTATAEEVARRRVAPKTTADDLTTTAAEEEAKILVETTTTAEDLATRAEAVEAKILVATTTTAEDLATTQDLAEEVARILVATTTAEDLTTTTEEVVARILVATTAITAEDVVTTTEDTATTAADELGRILVAATTVEPEPAVEPEAETGNSMEEEQTTGSADTKAAVSSPADGPADAKVADGLADEPARVITTVAPEETTVISNAKVAVGSDSSDENEETVATTTESDQGDHDQ